MSYSEVIERFQIDESDLEASPFVTADIWMAKEGLPVGASILDLLNSATPVANTPVTLLFQARHLPSYGLDLGAYYTVDLSSCGERYCDLNLSELEAHSAPPPDFHAHCEDSTEIRYVLGLRFRENYTFCQSSTGQVFFARYSIARPAINAADRLISEGNGLRGPDFYYTFGSIIFLSPFDKFDGEVQ